MKPVVLLLLVAAFTFVAAGITDVAYAQEEAAASGMSDGSKLIGAGIAFGRCSRWCWCRFRSSRCCRSCSN